MDIITTDFAYLEQPCLHNGIWHQCILYSHGHLIYSKDSDSAPLWLKPPKDGPHSARQKLAFKKIWTTTSTTMRWHHLTKNWAHSQLSENYTTHKNSDIIFMIWTRYTPIVTQMWRYVNLNIGPNGHCPLAIHYMALLHQGFPHKNLILQLHKSPTYFPKIMVRWCIMAIETHVHVKHLHLPPHLKINK
jgi:hypothetical protein